MDDSSEGSSDSPYSAGEGNGRARVLRLVDDESEEDEVMIRVGRRWRRLIKKAVVEDSDDEETGGRHSEMESEEEELVWKRSSKKQRVNDRVTDAYRDKSQVAKMSTRSKKGEKEMQEMWDSVAGDDDDESEEDDDKFIDDEGVPKENRVVYSDGEESDQDIRHLEAEKAEEDDDEDEWFFRKWKKKKKKLERTPEEIAMFVEQFTAKLDVAAEKDAELNRNSKPAIEKLKMLPELWTVLQLQMDFLDRGVLSSLKDWLEPLPDGSLPNMNIRTTLLKLLMDLPIDVEQFERRDQLKKSGLGKVVMFLSRLPEETAANRKLARDLVDQWSRPLFQKSTRYEDLRTYDEDRTLVKKAPQEFQNRARQQHHEEKRMKMNKKLQQLKTTKTSMQASKISVEGCGAVH